MRRRNFLATLAAASFAGCPSTGGGDSTPDRTTSGVGAGDRTTWTTGGPSQSAHTTADPTSTTATTAATSLTVPAKARWSDRGTFLELSDDGWDSNLDDCMSPCSLLRVDEQWLLYYTAASGTRPTDGGPAGRALGLATTSTPERPNSWEKHRGNPLITYQPNDDVPEEGVFCAGGLVHQGTVFLYAATCSDDGQNLVNCSVRLYTSEDGVSFTDRGTVLSNEDEVFGAGDELFPVAVTRMKDRWTLFYVAVSEDATWDLGAARASTPLFATPETLEVMSPSTDIHGFAGAFPTGAGTIIAPITGGIDAAASEITVDVRLTDPASDGGTPRRLRTWSFDDLRHGIMARDDKRWYMAYQTGDKQSFRMRTGPR